MNFSTRHYSLFVTAKHGKSLYRVTKNQERKSRFQDFKISKDFKGFQKISRDFGRFAAITTNSAVHQFSFGELERITIDPQGLSYEDINMSSRPI
jgi:hypothetical protein